MAFDPQELWRIIRGPMQWRVLWLWHSKFMVGVTGVVRDQDGRVLLLKHRLSEAQSEARSVWPPPQVVKEDGVLTVRDGEIVARRQSAGRRGDDMPGSAW
ncbi:hypothetical protein GCM10009760_51100 [Kitasatospora kazusensis]|uniref:Uncharacterized protein n=1 Tax=Kitasatospora kazusensis TaxID=407974 RepID=A0ABP5LT14_9ACTN